MRTYVIDTLFNKLLCFDAYFKKRLCIILRYLDALLYKHL